MKRILVLGNGNHVLIKNLIKHIRHVEKIKVDVFTYRKIKKQGESLYDKVYTANKPFDNFLKWFYKDRIKSKENLIRKRFSKIGKKYNLIHIHYLETPNLAIQDLILQHSSNILITIWGSDFYKRTDKELFSFCPLLCNASAISFTNNHTLNEFKTRTGINNNLTVLRFGLEPLQSLYENIRHYSKDKAKLYLRLDDNYVVTVGTNARKSQNHIPAINSLIKVRDKLPQKTTIVLPLTYLRHNRYMNELRDYCNQVEEFDFILLEKFLTDEELALWRIATDVLVQVQDTDQLSGAMQEHIYAGSKVITGSWLPYNIFISNGIKLFRVDKVAEVGDELARIINEPIDIHRHQKIIWELSSWANNAKNWLSLYNDIIN